MKSVRLGYEVGSGEAVEIPIRHMAVTGQTQESGKTTTLEALVARSGVTALAFVTKRGETLFSEGNRVQPYFRDRADWQFVDQLISAQLQEKNKFLRSWIIRICRDTKTLADVHAEIKKALKKAKGLSEGVYTQLDAYLDLIVPEIQRSKLAQTLELKSGLNVMDVSRSPLPMQMLFVQSAIDWVNEHATNTVVVVPEAWEFIPEGKGSPVKNSAVSLVRKGGGVGNHIWIDSQDMAGVDKVILRGCAVWLIGVQREANEIKRNLSNIPASIKRPSAASVATLERGQFFACWGHHTVKAYVQPAWMDDAVAGRLATGELKNLPRAPKREHKPADVILPIEEPTVTEAEARALREENEELRGQVEALRYQIENTAPPDDKSAPSPDQATDATSFDYEALRARLLKDPVLLRVLAQKSEIEVSVKRRVIEANEETASGRLAILITEKFFESAQKADRARDELLRRGFPVARPTVYKELDKLATLGFLTKESDGYRSVAAMKVNIVESR